MADRVMVRVRVKSEVFSAVYQTCTPEISGAFYCVLLQMDIYLKNKCPFGILADIRGARETQPIRRLKHTLCQIVMSMEAMKICTKMQHTNSRGLNTVEKGVKLVDVWGERNMCAGLC